MRGRLVLALVVAAGAGAAAAEDRPGALPGALIDALLTPVADAPALAAALEARGFRSEGLALAGPEALPPEIADPAYFYLRADVVPGAGPLILLECSRIGPGMLPHLPGTAGAGATLALPVVPMLQWAETAGFLPDAPSQLRCRADLLPVAAAGGPLALPDRATVEAALRARFAEVGVGPLDEAAGSGWALPPPSDVPDARPVAVPPTGPVTLIARSADPASPAGAVVLRYDHRDDGALHSLDLIRHGPPGG